MNIFLNTRLSLNGEDWIGDEQEMEEIVKDILDILYELNYYPDFTVYYSKAEMIRLFTNLSELEGIHLYTLTNSLDQIRILLLEISANQIENSHYIVSHKRYFYWDIDLISVIEVTGGIIAAAAECRAEGLFPFFIINIVKSSFSKRNIIPVVSDFHTNKSPILINLEWISDAMNIEVKSVETREVRNFSLSPKHGENGVGGWPNESKLYCSEIEAREYLQLALGHVGLDELFYYDKKQNLYLKFRFGGNNPENSYHGFHIEIADEAVQVPYKIKKRL